MCLGHMLHMQALQHVAQHELCMCQLRTHVDVRCPDRGSACQPGLWLRQLCLAATGTDNVYAVRAAGLDHDDQAASDSGMSDADGRHRHSGHQQNTWLSLGQVSLACLQSAPMQACANDVPIALCC